ncbi:uncharacterized protein [Magallana gigas]|uniref:uncharacterized protein isoform X5 n=1 Tax=Magallana gigas TaxID=29159 RepID=UPI00333F0712
MWPMGLLFEYIKMDQPTLQELTEHGQKFELKGSDLQKFIRDQQAHYRELRAAEREREKEAREYELKKQTLEMDRIKMQEEQGKAELESKYRATIFHLEQQLKETKVDIASYSSAKIPKMPFFDEVKDGIDSYLRRFERYAEAQKWKPDTWAVNLSALFRGRALDVYALLPQEQALNYDALKTSLLKRFERTEDGFRQRFRMCRPESVLSGRKESTTEPRNGSPNIQRDQKEQKSTKDAATTEKQVRCYKCSKIGHASFQCPQQRSRPREDSRSGHPYQTPVDWQVSRVCSCRWIQDKSTSCVREY